MVSLWKLDGTLLRTLKGHSAGVRNVAISPNGAFLASIGEDNTLIIGNLPWILSIDVLRYGGDRIRDYLQTNQKFQPQDHNSERFSLGDRHLCNISKQN